MRRAPATWILCSLSLSLLPACFGHREELKAGLYQGKHTRYAVADLGPRWRRVALEDNDLLFQAVHSPHSLALNATCEDHGDPTLEVLTRHLTMGFTDVSHLSQRRIPLDGREGLETHTRAKLDGVPVELLLVVLKKNRCVYDFTLLSPVGRVDEARADFDRVLSEFRTEGRRS